MLRWRPGHLLRLLRDESGSAIAETLIMAPVVFVLLGGVLEFGALLHSKVLIENGLRDAARYLARCPDATFGCTEDIAKQLAVFGSPDGSVARVGGWKVADINVAYSDPPFSGTGPGGEILYHDGEPVEVIRVSTDFDYPGGSLLGILGIPFVTITAFHEERRLEW